MDRHERELEFNLYQAIRTVIYIDRREKECKHRGIGVLVFSGLERENERRERRLEKTVVGGIYYATWYGVSVIIFIKKC